MTSLSADLRYVRHASVFFSRRREEACQRRKEGDRERERARERHPQSPITGGGAMCPGGLTTPHALMKKTARERGTREPRTAARNSDQSSKRFRIASRFSEAKYNCSGSNKPYITWSGVVQLRCPLLSVILRATQVEIPIQPCLQQILTVMHELPRPQLNPSLQTQAPNPSR